jgi:hypothetical protein
MRFGATANDRWVSNFDQFFVGLPITLSSLPTLQENLFLKVHMGRLLVLLAAIRSAKEGAAHGYP